MLGQTVQMVSIRSAQPDDAGALTMLIQESFTQYTERIGTEPGPMSTDYSALIGTGTVWIAEDGGLVIGTIVATPMDDHLLLDNLAVSPAARGLGLGILLLDWAAQHARTLGLSELRLYTNEAMTENLTFYPRRGFVETHRATVDGYRRVFYSKQL